MQWAQLAMMFLGNEKASKMDAKTLELLGKQYGDMMGISLPELQQMTPEQLGPSAVGSMQSDENLRGRQAQLLGDLENIIAQGGLDMADRAGLEEALNAASNQQSRARAGVAADAAQRGQLNSGSRLMMDLDATSKGANAARQTALDTAGMAERRRMQAMREASDMARGMRETDWREQESANRAKDLRDERNANAREKAGYYNAGLQQQNFQNQMAKTGAAGGATTNLANAYGNAAAGTRAEMAGYAGVLGATNNGGGSAYGGNSGGAYSYDSNDYAGRGSPSDLSKDDPEK